LDLVPEFSGWVSCGAAQIESGCFRARIRRSDDGHRWNLAPSCIVEDISDTGAKLGVESSIDGLALKEFFLVLSSTGLALPRCELAWVNGDRLGVIFKWPDKKNPRK
jgi:hypothetical protein